MKILAIDSSGQVAGCCLMDEEKVIGEIILDDKLTHSQTLMPMVDKLFNLTELSIKDIDYIAVANGPGSFTGLRIGVATAIGLARGSGAKLLGINTLEALAYNVSSSDYICPIMDARRNEVYSAIYSFNQGKFYQDMEPRAISIDSLSKKLDMYASITLVGDGIKLYKNILENKSNIKFATTNLIKQRPSSLAMCAYNKIVAGYYNDNININYLRKSQAERERDEKCQRG